MEVRENANKLFSIADRWVNDEFRRSKKILGGSESNLGSLGTAVVGRSKKKNLRDGVDHIQSHFHAAASVIGTRIW